MNALAPDSKIYVAGHQGMVGSALVRRLRSVGHSNLILRTRQELDLTDQRAVDAFFAQELPEFVFVAAAKAGGIHANSSYPAEFIRDNLLIQGNVIHSAWKSDVRKLLFLGSSCIYPRNSSQPIREAELLTGALEPTNEYYAIAKIAGIRMCQAYRKQYGFDAICAMPTNLYGPGDNYHPENSHVIPGLIRRFHEAKARGEGKVTIWGTGTPLREFLHADDLADALVFLMQNYSSEEIINIGSGDEISIIALAELIGRTIGFLGTVEMDRSKPDGTPRKLLDSTRLYQLGWRPSIGLEVGLAQSAAEFVRTQGARGPALNG